MIPFRLIASLAGEAHLFHAAKGQEIVRVLTSDDRAGVDWEQGASEEMAASNVRPYRVQEGLAIIPIEGSLLHRWESVRPYSGATGYDGIRVSLTKALSDDSVKGIMFDFDSPGGMVTGCVDLGEMIRDAGKPTAAYVDGMAYSAAYWLASQCDHIVASPSAGVGSIGAVMMHVDQSAALDGIGIKVTLLHSGSHKVDGNPYEALPDDVRDSIQSRLDAIRSSFAASVGAGRGERFTAAQAMATEAESYRADEALSMGMVDAIARPDQAISTISALLGITQETADMAEPQTGASPEEVEAMKAEIAAALREEMQAERDNMLADARAKIEREKAINAMDAPQAMKDRFLSDAFASVPVDEMKALVADAPKSIAAQMEAEGGAGVEASPSEFADDDGKVTRIHAAAEKAASMRGAL